MISQTVQDLSDHVDKQTDTQTNSHYWKQYHLAVLEVQCKGQQMPAKCRRIHYGNVINWYTVRNFIAHACRWNL